MARYHGMLKDAQGNDLIPFRKKEEDCVLEAALNPEDLYSVPSYVVGENALQIWLDGAYAPGGEQGAWQEYGTKGETSAVVLINDQIDAGTLVTIRVAE